MNFFLLEMRSRDASKSLNYMTVLCFLCLSEFQGLRVLVILRVLELLWKKLEHPLTHEIEGAADWSIFYLQCHEDLDDVAAHLMFWKTARTFNHVDHFPAGDKFGDKIIIIFRFWIKLVL